MYVEMMVRVQLYVIQKGKLVLLKGIPKNFDCFLLQYCFQIYSDQYDKLSLLKDV